MFQIAIPVIEVIQFLDIAAKLRILKAFGRPRFHNGQQFFARIRSLAGEVQGPHVGGCAGLNRINDFRAFAGTKQQDILGDACAVVSVVFKRGNNIGSSLQNFLRSVRLKLSQLNSFPNRSCGNSKVSFQTDKLYAIHLAQNECQIDAVPIRFRIYEHVGKIPCLIKQFNRAANFRARNDVHVRRNFD